MISKGYFRLATALVNSAVLVTAGGAYAEPAASELKKEAQQDDKKIEGRNPGGPMRRDISRLLK